MNRHFAHSNPPHRDAWQTRQAWQVLLLQTLIIQAFWTLAFGGLIGCSRNANRPVAENGASEKMNAPSTIAQRLVDISDPSHIRSVAYPSKDTDQRLIVDTLGRGLGALDFNNDGYSDLFFAGGGSVVAEHQLQGALNQLWVGGSKMPLRDVTPMALPEQVPMYSHGVAVGDIDNDGFDDILVTGLGELALFRNQGDGTFKNLDAETLFGEFHWATGAAWGDVNRDGNLDLYVAQYVNWDWSNNPDCLGSSNQPDVCSPTKFQGLDDRLLISQGDFTFHDASRPAGLSRQGKGLGVMMADWDADLDLDIYVANDTEANFIYLNHGDGRFTEGGRLSGASVDDQGMANGSMGVTLLDYNLDGRPDLYVTNFESDSFAMYRNEGESVFTHASGAIGLFAIGTAYVGWGTVPIDWDADGDDDLIVANGHVEFRPKSGSMKQMPLTLENRNGNFVKIDFPSDHYLGQAHNGRGLISADLDNDGDLELAFANLNEAPALLSNEQSPAARWLGIELVGVRSNRNAIGATVTLTTAAGSRTKTLVGGGSYLSHSDRRILWSLGTETNQATVTIDWPSSIKQKLTIERFNRYVRCVEQSP